MKTLYARNDRFRVPPVDREPMGKVQPPAIASGPVLAFSSARRLSLTAMADSAILTIGGYYRIVVFVPVQGFSKCRPFRKIGFLVRPEPGR